MTVRLAVTGANGFVGRALVRASITRGWAVRAVTRQAGPASSDEPGRWIPGRVDLLGGVDLARGQALAAAVSGADAVVHVAGRAHVLRELEADPLAAFRRVNTEATVALARAAAAAGVGRFVFVSSVGVNGNETHGTPFDESSLPQPREPYAVSKWEAEIALRAVGAETGLEVVIVRPPLVYGADAPGNFGRLRRLVSRGLPLPFGALRNRRSLVALGNLVDFLLCCVEHPAAADELFLVSDGEDLSTPELIRRLARALGRPARLLPVPVTLLAGAAVMAGRRDALQRMIGSLQIDSSRARTLLGWRPPLSVDEGLRQVAGA